MSQAINQVIPEGYKQTNFGLLPLDWSCLPLGELVTGASYGSSAKSASQGLVPVLRMGNLQDGFINWNDLVFTSDPVEINKYSLKKNDVLFNRTNTVDLVGKTAIYKGEYPAIYAGYLIKINNNEDVLNSEYLNYVLNTHQIKSYNRLVLSVAVSQANINAQKLKTYPIPIPPSIQEQTAIANALSDVDALLSELEKLIAKKQAIKTATMQQLLTGKTRLPQFAFYSDINSTEGAVEGKRKSTKPSELGEIPEDWDVNSLSEVCNFGGGTTPPRAQHDRYFVNGTHNWVKTTDLNNSLIDISEEQITTLAISEIGLKKHPVGSVLIAMYGGFNQIGRTGFITNPSAINQALVAIKPKSRKLNSYYLLSQLNYNVDYWKGVASSSRKDPNITSNDVKNYSILLPLIEEQTAIASILSDMDNEIQTLEQRLSKTRQIKQGMMQELLTGKTRLPFDKIADKE
jgi:type I restriction enzyme S subunit